MRVTSTELPPKSSADAGRLGRVDHCCADGVVHLHHRCPARDAQLGDLSEHGMQRHAAAILRHENGIATIGVDAEDPAQDHYDHQHISQGVDVPAELEAGV